MSDPRTDPDARLRAVRDEIDSLLSGDHPDLDPGDIQGVVFGLADGRQALVRATQSPEADPPPPLFRILGEQMDGMAQAYDQPMVGVAKYTLDMMEKSKASDEYSQRGSGVVERGDD